MMLVPTTATVTCAGRRHTLSWAAGVLTAIDHGDPERERALTALGGEPYRCLELLDAWENHRDDLDVVLLASRGPADRIPPDGGQDDGGGWRPGRRTGFQSFVAYSGAYGPLSHHHHHHAPRVAGVEDVLRLGGHLPDRLVAHMVSSWAQRLEDGAVSVERPRLHAALYGRFASVARDWLGELRLAVELTMIASDDAVSVERTDRGVQARLPFAWLADVWAPGLAVVADRLVLAAAQPQPGRFVLDTLGSGLTDRATVTIDVGAPS